MFRLSEFSIARALSAIAVIVSLAGCGQKGDLFLSTEPAEAVEATEPEADSEEREQTPDSSP